MGSQVKSRLVPYLPDLVQVTRIGRKRRSMNAISLKPHRVVSKATTSESSAAAAALRFRTRRTNVTMMSTTSSSQQQASTETGEGSVVPLRKAALSMTAAVPVLGTSASHAWSAPQPVVSDLAKAQAPVERKKGKVVRKVVKTKNFAEEGPVSIPSVTLPGASYSLPSFSGPSVSLPSFTAPSVSIDTSESLTAITPSTQAVAVFGAEVLAAGLATATVGSLTKEN